MKKYLSLIFLFLTPCAFAQRAMFQAIGTPQFQTTAVLDTATRANENPLSDGGKWTNNVIGLGNCQIVSNAIAAVASACDAKWTNAALGVNNEVYYTMSVAPATNDDTFVLAYDGTINGYSADFANDATQTVTLQKLSAGTPTNLLAVNTTFAAGDKLGLAHQGTTIFAYKVHAGVQTQLAVTTDATFVTSENGAIFLGDATVRATNFGGGAQ